MINNKNTFRIIVYGALGVACLALIGFNFYIKFWPHKNIKSANIKLHEFDVVVDRKQVINNNVEIIKTLNSDDQIIGNRKAPVMVIVYQDYANPYSADFFATVEKIKSEFTNSVVLAFRNYIQKNRDLSLSCSLAAECAGEQNKFWQMQSLLFSESKANSLQVQKFPEYSKSLGLNSGAFAECLKARRYQDRILRQTIEAENFSVYGTPAIFINNKLVIGARPFDDYLDSEGKTVKGIKSLINNQINDKN